MFFFDKPGFSLVILGFANFIVQNIVHQRKPSFNKEKPGITIAKPALTVKPGITIAKPGFTEKLVISQVKFDKSGFTKLFVSSNLGCKPNAH